MKHSFSIIIFFCFYYSVPLLAQNEVEPSLNIEEQLESQASSGEESVDLSELTDLSSSLLFNPINLNKATQLELHDCNLFSEQQIKNILLHRNAFGPLQSIEELQIVGFDIEFIRYVKPFITMSKNIDSPNAKLSRMLSDGNHSIIARVLTVNERKQGYKNINGTTKYIGNPQSYYLRYRFNFMKKLSLALVCENDAGEPFFNRNQKSGFDFYAGHLAIRDIGKFKIINLGDYQLQYGQGLSLWSGLSGGAATDPAFVIRNATGIKPYTSSNEVYFNRGAAASFQMNKWVIDLFYSYRKLDGSIIIDTIDAFSESLISSLQQTGYHRTVSEMDNKYRINEELFGTNSSYQINNFRIGATAFNSILSEGMKQKNEPYNLFKQTNNQTLITGIDIKWLYRNICYFGEISVSQLEQFAYLTGVIVSADPRLIFSVLYRNYHKLYQNRYSSAFGSGGSNNNESGIYGGVSYQITRSLKFTCSYDYYFFPWLKYRTDAPSNGNEFQCKFMYRPSRNTELYIRYRSSRRNINTSDENVKNNYVVPVHRSGMRIHVTSKLSKSFTLKSRVEYSIYNNTNSSESGFVVFQDIRYHPMGFPVSWNVRYALFDSDGYESRIYAYENDVLYGYSIPAYYHKGSRVYFNARIKIRNGLDFWFKYAVTFYTNLDEIGSGWEMIEGSRKSEFKLQLVYSSK